MKTQRAGTAAGLRFEKPEGGKGKGQQILTPWTARWSLLTSAATRRLKSGAAFTRVELVAVLAMVALLAALGLKARAGAGDQSAIAQCSGNLRQFALALQLYGSDYRDRLPSNSGVGSWAWDTAWNVGTLVQNYVPARGYTMMNFYGTNRYFSESWRIFYCPGTEWRFSESDNYRLWNYVYGGYRILGYVTTFSDTASLSSSNANPAVSPQPFYVKSILQPAPIAAERVLVADATISASTQTNLALKATYNWTSIRGGYAIAHTSPHLAGQLPLGGNVAMLDGHVEWRQFSQMIPRTTGRVPVFWW